MKDQGGSDWYLCCTGFCRVTAEQVRAIIARSIPFFFILGVLILLVSYSFYHGINSARIARASNRPSRVPSQYGVMKSRTPFEWHCGTAVSRARTWIMVEKNERIFE